MDRSILRLPDPNPGAPNGERRRSVRQKLHSPVYASFNGPQTGMVVDLSELLDLHEDGFAVRTSERLEVNRAVTLSLDLPETKNYVHGNGQVIWSDDAGRGGVRFSGLPETSRQILREWLFANLLIACSNHAARTEQIAEQLAQREDERLSHPHTDTEAEPKASNVVSISDGSGSHSLIEVVRREVGEIAGDEDAVLDLITESALNLTGASGAALAFVTDEKMVCRARAGEPSPPLGAAIDVKQGLSGECVRSGLLVSCADATSDPRVDPEVCRALGIASLMAAPIKSASDVVGLIEVFSRHPNSFTKAHETVLQQLVEMIPQTQRDGTPPGTPPRTSPRAPSAETLAGEESSLNASTATFTEAGSINSDSMQTNREGLLEESREVREISEQEPGQVLDSAPGGRFRLLHLGLIGMAIVIVAMVVGYVIQPMVEKRLPAYSQVSRTPSVEAASPVSGQNANGLIASNAGSFKPSPSNASLPSKRSPVMTLAELQKRADHGDPDAQWLIGERWHSGEELPQDDTEAVKWFRRAAEQGHVDAQATLGAYYWAGRGVPQDLSKAYFWSTIALAEGDENSKSRLEGLASQMTQTQVSTARQQAEEWIHGHSQRAKSEAN